MGGAFGQALVLIINSLGGILILAVLLRFLLQAARADFYNPLTQAIVKITAPMVNPLRRVIPGYRGIDFASLVLALILSALATLLMLLAVGTMAPVGSIVSWALVGLIAFILKIYFWALVISVVASFIAPFSGHPGLLLVHQLLDPFYRLVRRVIPAMGGLDFSPLFLFLGIQVVEILLLNPLAQSLGVNALVASLVIGI